MPDPKALTPEQINLLRGLPSGKTGKAIEKISDEDLANLAVLRKLHLVNPRHAGCSRYRQSDHATILLATIDSERERVLEAIVGNMENAATDCDGHTPYSILMALAEEIRAEHSANPPTQTEGEK